MKCIECGKNNLDDAKFCAYCGAAFKRTRAAQPEEKEETRAGARPLSDNPVQPRRMPHVSDELDEQPTRRVRKPIVRSQEDEAYMPPRSARVAYEEEGEEEETYVSRRARRSAAAEDEVKPARRAAAPVVR